MERPPAIGITPRIYVCKYCVYITGCSVVAIVTLNLRYVNKNLCKKIKNGTFAKFEPQILFTLTLQIYKMHILLFRSPCVIIRKMEKKSRGV